METVRSRLSWNMANLNSPAHTMILVCFMATLSYLAASLGGALIIYPQTVWPLWPGCALLVSVVLLFPRRLWPILIPAGFAGFVLYDLQAGVPIRSTAWLILADTVEVLTAALCLNYFFDGVPRLNSVRALAKYSFFAVILAPFAGAFVGALAANGNYWTSWRLSFFSEALAFLTLAPAILSWFNEGKAWARKSRSYFFEAAALLATLILLGYFTFIAPGRSSQPALLYSLVPFLLWSALRFGSMGVSSAVIVVAFLSVWGAVHGRGPFIEPEPINKVLSLQLFLFFTAAPFMVLAALVEEHKRAEEALRESKERERARAAELEAVLDTAPVAILIAKDAECKQIIANRSGYEWLGLEVGTNVSKSGPPDERPTHRLMRDGVEIPPEKLPMQRAATGTAIFEAPLSVVSDDGTERHAIFNAAPLFGEDGKPRGAVGALMDVTERKRAEQVLRESEERFRLVANTAPVLIWMSGADKLRTFFNQGWLDFTGRSMEQELGEGWASGLYPDDLNHCLGIYSAAFSSRVDFEMEYRLRRFDGEYRWIVDYGVPRFESDGSFRGYIGSCVDITERKSSEESLQTLSGRLIRAHEEERSRIARELHDDFSQRLALLGIGLGQLWKMLPESEAEERAKILEMLKGTKEMSLDMHSLSHQLHSSKLELVGLVPALNGVCKEISEKYKLAVHFTVCDFPLHAPKDVELCLFRVAQEALGNVVKHSQAKSAQVELGSNANGVSLRITDAGRGFDPDLGNPDAGIGLVGMRERLRLVGGRLSVNSELMHGTEILAEVPLAASADEAQVRTQAAGK
jgi:PAS domain S-box-containing protein